MVSNWLASVSCNDSDGWTACTFERHPTSDKLRDIYLTGFGCFAPSGFARVFKCFRSISASYLSCDDVAALVAARK